MEKDLETSEGQITVVLAEDHHVVRQALHTHLQQKPDITVVGEAADGSELLEMVAAQQPDVLLMDLEMPDHDPSEATAKLRRQYPAMKIIVLSAHNTPQYVVGQFKLGVDGYVLKADTEGSPVEAIRQVVSGEQWISPQVATVLADYVRMKGDSMEARLTDRENDILTLVAGGYRNGEIAEMLVISVHTVRNHVANIFKKLGVETRIEAVVFALSTGLVSLETVKEEFEDRSQTPLTGGEE